MFEIINI